ncbi:hypothetical protein FRACYDRAFT_250690 [Fragilariopsis cylindrus CCMP1102]|uniref:Uncharacterized protein n=1 Tax=Fragilariopsis cylindrus CCMP1102 TaxID=635003 RepID=A0A1E7EP09_9STRA|nr:hypothetical protein FRACYDRAFT_250690 [Fragilariopsis cylindrus CCMP1102]|eukprot:OEU07671.1 hypothetical protein FRACYDRAFT_250690 [Fragilariopsis cylindrus CCMP1102]
MKDNCRYINSSSSKEEEGGGGGRSRRSTFRYKGATFLGAALSQQQQSQQSSDGYHPSTKNTVTTDPISTEKQERKRNNRWGPRLGLQQQQGQQKQQKQQQHDNNNNNNNSNNYYGTSRRRHSLLSELLQTNKCNAAPAAATAATAAATIRTGSQVPITGKTATASTSTSAMISQNNTNSKNLVKAPDNHTKDILDTDLDPPVVAMASAMGMMMSSFSINKNATAINHRYQKKMKKKKKKSTTTNNKSLLSETETLDRNDEPCDAANSSNNIVPCDISTRNLKDSSNEKSITANVTKTLIVSSLHHDAGTSKKDVGNKVTASFDVIDLLDVDDDDNDNEHDERSSSTTSSAFEIKPPPFVPVIINQSSKKDLHFTPHSYFRSLCSDDTSKLMEYKQLTKRESGALFYYGASLQLKNGTKLSFDHTCMKDKELIKLDKLFDFTVHHESKKAKRLTGWELLLNAFVHYKPDLAIEWINHRTQFRKTNSDKNALPTDALPFKSPILSPTKGTARVSNGMNKIQQNNGSLIPTKNDVIVGQTLVVEDKRLKKLFSDGLALGTYKEQLQRSCKKNYKGLNKITKSIWADIKKSKHPPIRIIYQVANSDKFTEVRWKDLGLGLAFRSWSKTAGKSNFEDPRRSPESKKLIDNQNRIDDCGNDDDKLTPTVIDLLDDDDDDGEEEGEEEKKSCSIANEEETTVENEEVDIVINRAGGENIVVDREEDSIIDLLEDDDDDDVIVLEQGQAVGFQIEVDNNGNEDDDDDCDDAVIIGSTGKNANSDYAHSRADCATNPFEKDPKMHCPNCYCYVCDDKASDCVKWDSHCQATRSESKWRAQRSQARSKRKRPERALHALDSCWSQGIVQTKRTRRSVNYSET